MPPNTAKIDRSTRWGNPFRIGFEALHPVTRQVVSVQSAETAVELFTVHLQTAGGAAVAEAAQRELRGKDVACWCKAGNICHGDVLLEVANQPAQLRRAA